MRKKSIFQAILVFLLFALLVLFYQNYFRSNQDLMLSKSDKNKIETDSQNENQNIIKNIEYNASNIQGDSYSLTADIGQINANNANLMFMTNVVAIIDLKENDMITISSDHANFNNKTYETTFIDNVKILRSDEIITSEKLYLALDASEDDLKKNPYKQQNLIRIYDNVIFKKPGYNLKTDIIEIDLITKNFKIYMKNRIDSVIVNKFN